MGHNFNLKRAYLLLKSIFIFYKSFFRFALFAYIGVITILSIIDIVTSRNGILVFNAAPIGLSLISLVVLGMFPIAGYFQYHSKLYVNVSHMLPASVNEKFFVPLFIISILTPVLLYGIYVILISLFGGISELINNNTGVYFDSIFSALTFSNKEYLVPLLIGAMLAQSVCGLSLMLFGKRFMLALFGFYGIIQIMFTIQRDIDLELLKLNHPIVIVTIVSLLFWTISYLKFRKLQIKK